MLNEIIKSINEANAKANKALSVRTIEAMAQNQLDTLQALGVEVNAETIKKIDFSRVVNSVSGQITHDTEAARAAASTTPTPNPTLTPNPTPPTPSVPAYVKEMQEANKAMMKQMQEMQTAVTGAQADTTKAKRLIKLETAYKGLPADQSQAELDLYDAMYAHLSEEQFTQVLETKTKLNDTAREAIAQSGMSFAVPGSATVPVVEGDQALAHARKVAKPEEKK